jgi:hypothetical protein
VFRFNQDEYRDAHGVRVPSSRKAVVLLKPFSSSNCFTILPNDLIPAKSVISYQSTALRLERHQRCGTLGVHHAMAHYGPSCCSSS